MELALPTFSALGTKITSVFRKTQPQSPEVTVDRSVWKQLDSNLTLSLNFPDLELTHFFCKRATYALS